MLGILLRAKRKWIKPLISAQPSTKFQNGKHAFDIGFQTLCNMGWAETIPIQKRKRKRIFCLQNMQFPQS